MWQLNARKNSANLCVFERQVEVGGYTRFIKISSRHVGRGTVGCLM